MRASHNLRTIFHNVKWQYHGEYIQYRILLSVSIYTHVFIVLKSHWNRYPLWGHHLESGDTGSLITTLSQGSGSQATFHTCLIRRSSWIICDMTAYTLGSHAAVITVIYSSWYANACNLPSQSIGNDSSYWFKISGLKHSVWRVPFKCTMEAIFYIIYLCEAVTVHAT
jgi:hypothetical protein